MAFTVEDGTQISGANAYIALAAWKIHHDDRGRVYTDAYTDAEIQAAIVKASDYLDKRFAKRYRGTKAGTVQGLQWPRNNAIDIDNRTMTGIPDALLKAAAEYAWVSLTLGTELCPVPGDYAGAITSEKIGPITTKYSENNRPMVTSGNMIEGLPAYPEADLWVEQLIEAVDRRLSRA